MSRVRGVLGVLWRGARAPAAALLCACAMLGAGAAARAAEGSWWHPPQRLTWYWQLTGTLRTGVPAAAYDVDGFETTAAQVSALHGEGRRVVCYLSVGTAESWRPDYESFPKSVLGRRDGSWQGERWIDIRRLSVIEPIMQARFRMCAQKGFDAVEPDNIEAFANSSGFPITAAQQLTYNLWVAQAVHALGMAVLQKNDAQQSAQQQPHFDGALTEQCNQYRECADFAPYLSAGEPVLNAEYSLATGRFCAADEAAGIMGARYGLALDGKRYEPCW